MKLIDQNIKYPYVKRAFSYRNHSQGKYLFYNEVSISLQNEEQSKLGLIFILGSFYIARIETFMTCFSNDFSFLV